VYENAPVVVSVEIAGVCRERETGRIEEYPYCGDPLFALVAFDEPSGDRNEYPLRRGEFWFAASST
jgi:hypothetical protein